MDNAGEHLNFLMHLKWTLYTWCFGGTTNHDWPKISNTKKMIKFNWTTNKWTRMKRQNTTHRQRYQSNNSRKFIVSTLNQSLSISNDIQCPQWLPYKLYTIHLQIKISSVSCSIQFIFTHHRRNNNHNVFECNFPIELQKQRSIYRLFCWHASRFSSIRDFFWHAENNKRFAHLSIIHW